jgi:aspartate 1-decarboxylase
LRKIIIPLALLALIIVVLGYVALKPAPVVEVKAENVRLYSALANMGIEDAVVDVTQDKVLVRYNLPANMDMDTVSYYVMGAAAQAAPDSKEIILQVYEDMQPVKEVTVNTSDVISFINERMTLTDFQAVIKTSSLK